MINIIGDTQVKRGGEFNTKESSVKTEGRNVNDHVEQMNESTFKVSMNKKPFHQSKGSMTNKQPLASTLFSTAYDNAPRIKAVKSGKN